MVRLLDQESNRNSETLRWRSWKYSVSVISATCRAALTSSISMRSFRTCCFRRRSRPYFGRHPLGDACQLPQGVVPTGDAVQLSAFEASRLDGCRRRDDLAHLLQIFLLEVVEAFPGKPRIDSGPKAGVPQLVGT